MRKIEVVALHSLFGELRRNVEARDVVEPEAFAEYDELGVSPVQIHRKKAAHERAMLALSRTLADELAAVSKYSGEEAAETTPASG